MRCVSNIQEDNSIQSATPCLKVEKVIKKKKGRPRKLTNTVSNDKKDTNSVVTNTSENIDIDNKLVNFHYYNSYIPNCNSIDDFCTLDQYITTPSINIIE